MGLVFRGMLWCYRLADFVKSLVTIKMEEKQLKPSGYSWTNKVTQHFPIQASKSFKPWPLMDSQVVASGGKLNLRRDLCWMAKRTGKFPHKHMQVANKPNSRTTFPIFHWLMIG